MTDIKVLLVAPSEICRRSLGLLIGNFPGMQVIGECPDGVSALARIQEQRPDAVLMDCDLSLPGTVELVKELGQKSLAEKTVVLVRRFDASLFRKLMQNKVKGFLLKSGSVDLLMTAIRTVATGKVYLDPDVVSDCLDQVFSLDGENSETTVKKLSPREEEVMRLWVGGATSREISQQLNRSSKTVDALRARAFTKLGLHSRSEAVNYALREGWLAAGESINS